MNATDASKQPSGGDERAASEILPMVYDELRRLARYHLSRERAGHTLQATALVHEVYIKLCGDGAKLNLSCKTTFFALASEGMRRVLVDSARRRLSLRRGGQFNRSELAVEELPVDRPEELLAVHEALDMLEAEEPQLAKLVKLHYFGGFTLSEAADLLGVSRSTANRWWAYARSWLRTCIEKSGSAQDTQGN